MEFIFSIVNYLNTIINSEIRSIRHKKIDENIYYIDEFGSVLNIRTNQWLKGQINKKGYLYYHFPKICTSAHKLVLLTFGNKEIDSDTYYTVDHRDHDTLNNHHTNLRWLLLKENSRDRLYTFDNSPHGSINGQSKLNEEQAKEIYCMAKNKFITQKRIGSIFNVSDTCVRDIKSKRRWKWLTDDIDKNDIDRRTWMDQIANYLVTEYILDHLDKSDETPVFEVFTVWKCKTLQNWKYLLSSTLYDGMYYELTFNGDKQEWYLDAYKKFENQCISMDSIDIEKFYKAV